MNGVGQRDARIETATHSAAAALTLGLIVLATLNAPRLSPPALEAPKPTAVRLTVVEEPPPPPPPPPPEPAPPPPPEPPPPQAAAAPLPPPPPPRPRHIVRPKRPPPPHPVPRTIETPPRPPVPDQTYARVAQQAPENHSAEAAYIGRLHSLVARNTSMPHSASFRLHHPSGEALIGFTLSRSGNVSSVAVIRSSGSDILDAQALAIVSGLRYPPMPADVYPGAPAHRFDVPVLFPDTGGSDSE